MRMVPLMFRQNRHPKITNLLGLFEYLKNHFAPFQWISGGYDGLFDQMFIMRFIKWIVLGETINSCCVGLIHWFLKKLLLKIFFINSTNIFLKFRTQIGHFLLIFLLKNLPNSSGFSHCYPLLLPLKFT